MNLNSSDPFSFLFFFFLLSFLSFLFFFYPFSFSFFCLSDLFLFLSLLFLSPFLPSLSQAELVAFFKKNRMKKEGWGWRWPKRPSGGGWSIGNSKKFRSWEIHKICKENWESKAFKRSNGSDAWLRWLGGYQRWGEVEDLVMEIDREVEGLYRRGLKRIGFYFSSDKAGFCRHDQSKFFSIDVQLLSGHT